MMIKTRGAISNNHDLPTNFMLEILRYGPDNNVFLVKDGYDKKLMVVRINKRNVGKEVAFEIAWIKKLTDIGIPLPKIVKTRTGRDFFLIGNKHACVAFEYIEGYHLEITPDNKPDLALVSASAKALARFHNASLSININLPRKRNIFTEVERVLESKNEFINNSEGGNIFIEELITYTRWAKMNNNTKFLIHNDYRTGNVLFKKKKVVAIIDFDWSCKGPAIKDVAHSLAEWSYPNGGGKYWSEVFDAFLMNYNKLAKNKIRLDGDLYKWICFSCLSDAANYFMNLAEEGVYKKISCSYMYQKYLFFRKLDNESLLL